MLAKTYRIGVLGLVHDHVWGNLDQLEQTPYAQLVAAADPNRPLLNQVADRHECATYTDYEELLDAHELDAVYLYSDNATSAELGALAAERGLHILLEKPMAGTLADADSLLAAVRNHNVRLMVNWPYAWWPQLQLALEMCARGDLGDLWHVRYRAAHAGPKETECSSYFYQWLFDREANGAGALIDYGCYGALLARVLLGIPSRVWATAGRLCKEDIQVDDNALIVMSYPRATAVAEASWTEIGKLTAYRPTIHGTLGTLVLEPRAGGRLLWATAEHPEGVEVEVPEPPTHLRTASAHFVHCLDSGEEFMPLCTDRAARDAQEVLEAALLSSDTSEQIALPLPLA